MNIKKILWIICITILLITLSGCATWQQKALDNGYIKASDCPTTPKPAERSPLPHPIVPIFKTTDENGNYIKPTMNDVLELVIKYGATISKFQYLVEIYEREYLNIKGSSLFNNLSLEELRVQYLTRIGKIADVKPTSTKPTNTNSFTTSSKTDEKSTDNYLNTIEHMNLNNEKYNEEVK